MISLKWLIRFFHFLPDFKGKRRLAKLIFRNDVKNSRDISVVGINNLVYKLPNLLETVGFEILVNGIYEQETSDFIIEQLPEKGHFLDIGANIGAVVIPVIHKRKDITAISIEASPRIFNYLKENVRLNNLSGIQLVNKAITEISGDKVNFFSPESNYGKGSLSPVFTDKPEEVETITLDSLYTPEMKKPDFIKIDVEGYEYKVFRGGEKMLSAADAPDILLEFVDWAEGNAGASPGTAQRLLLAFGYSIYRFENGWDKKQRLTAPLISAASMLFATKKDRSGRQV